MSDNISALSGRKGLKENLFDRMVEAGKPGGTPKDEELKSLAHEYLIGEAITYGTASFYDFLKEEHADVKAHVCNGSACLVANTQEQVQDTLAKHLQPHEIGHMCCLGRCHETAAFNYKGKNYSGDAIEHLEEIVSNNVDYSKDEYSVTSLGTSVLTGKALDSAEMHVLTQKLLENGAEWALEQIKDSKIRGRGGAGFPMGFKFEACRNEVEDEKYIVCNADEGDPGAYSDRYLLEVQPNLVLYGMIVAGFVTGANWGAVYIRAEYPESVEAVTSAIEELTEAGLLGENILDSDFSFLIKAFEGAGAYICGEETALLSSLEGQRPEVRIRPPFPAQKGLFNKPTIVNNVETLAAIPWIIDKGGSEYAKLGTERSTGTKLVCLDSYFVNPGLYEVEMGESLDKLVFEKGGGFTESVKAIHVGGPLGGLVPFIKIKELTVDFESFADAGFLLGHAGVVSLPERFPLVSYLEHLFEFTADESCGKCFPCAIGSVRGKEMFENAKEGVEKIDRTLLEDLLETLEIGSLCALGGGLPLAINNALEHFNDELEVFFKKT